MINAKIIKIAVYVCNFPCESVVYLATRRGVELENVALTCSDAKKDQPEPGIATFQTMNI